VRRPAAKTRGNANLRNPSTQAGDRLMTKSQHTSLHRPAEAATCMPALQQPDHDPCEHANGSPPRDRQHGERGAATTHPRRSLAIDTVGPRHGVLLADPLPPQQRTAAPGGGAAVVERVAAGRGDTNLRRPSTPAGGRAMRKSQHTEPLGGTAIRYFGKRRWSDASGARKRRW
jgi:hypothetical protein